MLADAQTYHTLKFYSYELSLLVWHQTSKPDPFKFFMHQTCKPYSSKTYGPSFLLIQTSKPSSFEELVSKFEMKIVHTS